MLIKNYLNVIIFLVLTVIVATVINILTWSNVINAIIEWFFLSVILLILFSIKPLQSFFTCLPKPHKIAAVVILFCMLVGQLIIQTRMTFPFAAWSMFSSTISDTSKVTFYRYYGIGDSGQRVHINPARLFPTLSHGRIGRSLNTRIEQVLRQEMHESGDVSEQESNESPAIEANIEHGLLREILTPIKRRALARKAKPDPETVKQQLNELLNAVGNMHNHKNPRLQIRSIEVVKVKLERFSRSLYGETSEPVWIVELQEEGKQ